MTHEDPERGHPEEHGGPQHDHSLPHAVTIPETTDVEASLAPSEQIMGVTTVLGTEPGWWNKPDAATRIPRWSGPTENEA